MAFWLYLLLALSLGGLGYRWLQRYREAMATARRQQARAERQRVEACGEVVRHFANHHGYLARQVIGREELAQLIAAGLSPQELTAEITRRMDAHQGLVLGFQPGTRPGARPGAGPGASPDHPPVKLTQEFRDRHIYIIGKSGSGKTNLLRNLILQDLAAGNGLGVIAPEQEMITEEILPYIPAHRLDQVIYFNPADEEAPVSFNPLHLDPGEDIDLRVDENMIIFKRAIGEASGPRMDEILRQLFYALLARPASTLLDVEPLLSREDPTLRNEVIRQSQDPNTVRFWRDTYPQFPKDAHLPITNRLSRLTRPRSIRQLLCQPQGSLSFRQAMDTGKVLLFNLSDGILGEANSQLLGQLIVSKFQTAVMSRANVPPEQRRPFYLYIDEFQTFTGGAATSYEKMLSRARKYRLSLILAHQQTGQIPQPLLKEILGNVSTLIAFVVSRQDALRLSGELLSEVDGQVASLPSEELLTLKVGEAWCKIGRNTVFMKTHLAPQAPDYAWAEQVRSRSRQLYGGPVLGTGGLVPPAEPGRAPAAPGAAPSGRKAAPPAGPAVDPLADLDPGEVF